MGWNRTSPALTLVFLSWGLIVWCSCVFKDVGGNLGTSAESAFQDASPNHTEKQHKWAGYGSTASTLGHQAVGKSSLEEWATGKGNEFGWQYRLVLWLVQAHQLTQDKPLWAVRLGVVGPASADHVCACCKWGPWREASPRRRVASPRRKGDWNSGGGKGSQFPGGAKGKGKGQAEGKGFAAPALQDLPKPPKPAQLALPKGGSGQAGPSNISTAAGSSDALLQALLSHVATEELPESIRDAVGQYKSTSIKLNAKHMHSLVSAQQQARRELGRIRQERDNYEFTWEAYVQKLTDLFAQQVKEREEALDAFEHAEKEWLAQLEQATQDLQQMATVEGQKADASVDAVMPASDMEDAVAAAELERVQRRREQVAEQNAGVLSALKSAKAIASEAVKRDGSRTPRRAPSKNVVDLVSPCKDGEGGGLPPQ